MNSTRAKTHKDVKMARTFDETSAATADNGEYDEQHDDEQTTHTADYHNSMHRHFTRHCNDNNDHSVLPQPLNDNSGNNRSAPVDKVCSCVD